MAASFTIAARNNGLTVAEGKSATTASVRAYREAMAQFAQMRTMDLWYAHLSEDDLRAAIAKIAQQGLRKKDVKRAKDSKGSKTSKGWSTGPPQKVDTEVARRAARQGDKIMPRKSSSAPSTCSIRGTRALSSPFPMWSRIMPAQGRSTSGRSPVDPMT
jgi:hypothetical protein